MKKGILLAVGVAALGVVAYIGCSSSNFGGGGFGTSGGFGVLVDGNGDPIGDATVLIQCPAGDTCNGDGTVNTARVALGDDSSCDTTPGALAAADIFDVDCTDDDDATDDGTVAGSFALVCPPDTDGTETVDYVLPTSGGFTGQQGTFSINCDTNNGDVDVAPTPTP